MATTLTIAVLISLGATVMLAARTWQRVRTLPGPETVRLLEELRRRIDALERAVERRATEGRSGRQGRARRQRIDPAQADAVPGPTLIAVPNLASVAEPRPPASDELGRRFGPIWSLADAGFSAEAIAERTGQPIGQVELILGLRRRAGASRPVRSSHGKRD